MTHEHNITGRRNIRLRLAYEGTRFSGWQVQPQRSTIQGCIEDAIEKVSGERVRLLSAGRTDAGVHALGQVANFQTSAPVPPEKWRPALQSHLPKEIVILESDEVPEEFHATFSARSKRYRYVIYNHLVANPFLDRFSWRIAQPLDVDAMQDAASCLLGKHDFRSFESNWPNKATSVRTIQDLTVQRRPVWELFDSAPAEHATHNSGDLIFLEIEADGFLYNMVRAITGTLAYVGRGTWTKADVERILKAQDRAIAGATAPACGLFMVRVNYTEDLKPLPKPVEYEG